LKSGGNSGFTLVEILVVSVILFAVVTTGTLVFRNTIQQVGKVTVQAQIARSLQPIIALVREEIKNGTDKGSGIFGRKINYQWQSEVIRTSRNIVSSYDERTGGPEYGIFQMTLHTVFLTIVYGDGGKNHQEQYEYQELSWAK